MSTPLSVVAVIACIVGIILNPVFFAELQDETATRLSATRQEGEMMQVQADALFNRSETSYGRLAPPYTAVFSAPITSLELFVEGGVEPSFMTWGGAPSIHTPGTYSAGYAYQLRYVPDNVAPTTLMQFLVSGGAPILSVSSTRVFATPGVSSAQDGVLVRTFTLEANQLPMTLSVDVVWPSGGGTVEVLAPTRVWVTKLA